jgi:hypothetical protein
MLDQRAGILTGAMESVASVCPLVRQAGIAVSDPDRIPGRLWQLRPRQ